MRAVAVAAMVAWSLGPVSAQEVLVPNSNGNGISELVAINQGTLSELQQRLDRFETRLSELSELHGELLRLEAAEREESRNDQQKERSADSPAERQHFHQEGIRHTVKATEYLITRKELERDRLRQELDRNLMREQIAIIAQNQAGLHARLQEAEREISSGKSQPFRGWQGQQAFITWFQGVGGQFKQEADRRYVRTEEFDNRVREQVEALLAAKEVAIRPVSGTKEVVQPSDIVQSGQVAFVGPTRMFGGSPPKPLWLLWVMLVTGLAVFGYAFRPTGLKYMDKPNRFWRLMANDRYRMAVVIAASLIWTGVISEGVWVAWRLLLRQ